MTTTAKARPTRTYITDSGHKIQAVRVPSANKYDKPRYDLLVDGEKVESFTGRSGYYQFAAMGGRSYITAGGIDDGLLYAIASSVGAV